MSGDYWPWYMVKPAEQRIEEALRALAERIDTVLARLDAGPSKLEDELREWSECALPSRVRSLESSARNLADQVAELSRRLDAEHKFVENLYSTVHRVPVRNVVGDE